ncbi:hypothetical protein CLV46_2539 [Diaminobutyricimonas aerilata]|uniref:Uncharacterized protein n=1 Tax=Diaminobutyricimonas aerilata TaxID=1162967 RepID=A0A2M9CM44_9MICO|nr:hypothetical protein [Diaminobutyricimonas aerilata]PJJ72959.1 hypothetical protein CLV46_2539 [Diaminobutyricimonas aerilata]
MRSTSRILPLLGAAAIALSLTGCTNLLGAPLSADEREAAPETPTVSEEAQRAYYDNVVLLFELSETVLGDEAGSFGAPTVRGTWSEVDEAAHDEQIEAGLAACEMLEHPDAAPDAELRTLMPWLASRFLCEDQRTAAEEAVSAEYGDEILRVLDASLLKGGADAKDVFQAVDTCGVTIELFYTLSAEYTPDYFCWIMRANVNSGNDHEDDFLFLFRHTDDEQELADAKFDEWARQMGATPNFLGELSEQPR